MADFDFSELDRLAADLGKVADTAGPFINSAIQGTSVRVKKAAQKTAGSGNRRWRALPSAIDYEVTVFQGFGSSVIKSEIGYNKDEDAGKLGNIREFGNSRVAPHNDLVNAVDANKDDFVKGLSKALSDAEKKAGL
tara:strand:+ start:187 stop:594 length:408 start_codon:yes stop_codon:yes gene_type:complete